MDREDLFSKPTAIKTQRTKRKAYEEDPLTDGEHTIQRDFFLVKLDYIYQEKLSKPIMYYNNAARVLRIKSIMVYMNLFPNILN